MDFFTADTHFGHRGIIKYCDRPFSDVEEMDRSMIERWNSVVQPRDMVYHLGDFAFCHPDRAVEIIHKLHGRIHLLRGNHDKTANHPKVRNKFEWIKDMHTYHQTWQGEKVRAVLCHYALRRWNKRHYGSWHLYGHSHGRLKDIGGLCFDIGVDSWDYYPLSLPQVWDIMQSRDMNLVEGEETCSGEVWI